MLTPVHMKMFVCFSRILKPYLSWWVWIGSVDSMGSLLGVVFLLLLPMWNVNVCACESFPYGNHEWPMLNGGSSQHMESECKTTQSLVMLCDVPALHFPLLLQGTMSSSLCGLLKALCEGSHYC